ncbi:hypothetical protein [Aquimarina brevivitae]|nr:hypothetical protein [Aquimarina brevivitae]
MNLELENLQSTIKRKYSFKYKPEFSESFKTDSKESQIIPLTIEVFEKLEWPIVYRDTNSVEAKRKGDWNKLTEKITVTKKAAGRIEVHSKSIEGNFIDFGKNSLRTGLFIALFKKLETEYKENGKLEVLETEFEKQSNWDDYEIPAELPKPKQFRKPSLSLSILGGLSIVVLFGVLIAFLTVSFTYVIGLYELGIGLGIGYLFGQVLKKTNYVDFNPIQFVLAGMMIVMFITNQFTQYQMLIAENNISEFSFLEFINIRFKGGLTIKSLNTGWIGLTLSWIFQMTFPYFLALARIGGITTSYTIEKVPKEALEYTVYLFEMNKSESEVRAVLSQKGWNKKVDQDMVFQAIGAILGFQEMNRE